jgi:hypothetical protein
MRREAVGTPVAVKRIAVGQVKKLKNHPCTCGHTGQNFLVLPLLIVISSLFHSLLSPYNLRQARPASAVSPATGLRI